MLGPSGSGKTTVLRMIAGFEQPTSGEVHLGGRDVTRDAPFDRDVNTVFQDYALFPHMSVQENVAYGLMVKGVGRSERRRRAERGAGQRPARGLRRPAARSALRRPAAAGRPGARAGQPATRPAARRAPRRPRPQAPRGDAGRAQGHPARRRHHLPVRHPRPGGGADDERPDRGLLAGPDRAGRHRARGLRAAGVGVRRRLRRHVEPADRRGRPGRARRPRRRLGTSREAARRAGRGGRTRRGDRRRRRHGGRLHRCGDAGHRPAGRRRRPHRPRAEHRGGRRRRPRPRRPGPRGVRPRARLPGDRWPLDVRQHDRRERQHGTATGTRQDHEDRVRGTADQGGTR